MTNVVNPPQRGPEGKWHDDIQCFVITFGLHCETGIGMLLVDRNSSTNMSGVIRAFKKLDPEVSQIMVLRGPSIDIVYVKGEDGKWFAENRRG